MHLFAIHVVCEELHIIASDSFCSYLRTGQMGGTSQRRLRTLA